MKHLMNAKLHDFVKESWHKISCENERNYTKFVHFAMFTNVERQHAPRVQRSVEVMHFNYLVPGSCYWADFVLKYWGMYSVFTTPGLVRELCSAWVQLPICCCCSWFSGWLYIEMFVLTCYSGNTCDSVIIHIIE